MSDATFTFRVEESLKHAFTNIAKARDRSGAQLLRDFMREVVRQEEDSEAYERWFRERVQQAVESANSGNLIPGEKVEAAFAARRAALKRRLDTPD
ncbi:MAG: CopG family ribbon-helix-helix protein [Luteimonas sp.]